MRQLTSATSSADAFRHLRSSARCTARRVDELLRVGHNKRAQQGSASLLYGIHASWSCIAMMEAFDAGNPELWNEDIGEPT